MAINKWTKKETAILKDFYPTASEDEMEKLLPSRSKSAIIAKASKIQVKKNVKHWTKAEFKILKKHYPSTTNNQELLDLLPNHTFVAIKAKAKIFGLRRGNYLPDSKESTVRRWTKDEVDILRLYYNTMEDKDMMLLLPGRTIMGAKHIVRKLNLGAKETGFHAGEFWTATEDSFLIDNFSKLPNEELMKFLDSRTLVAIKARAQKLGLKRSKHAWASIGAYRPWTPNEIEILEKNWNKMSLDELSAIIKTRSNVGLIKQAKKMGMPVYNKEKFEKPKKRKNART